MTPCCLILGVVPCQTRAANSDLKIPLPLSFDNSFLFMLDIGEEPTVIHELVIGVQAKNKGDKYPKL